MKKIQILLALSFAFLCLIVCFIGSDLGKKIIDLNNDNISEVIREDNNQRIIISNFETGKAPIPENFGVECKIPEFDTDITGNACKP